MHAGTLFVIQCGWKVVHGLCRIFFKLNQLCVELLVLFGKAGWIDIHLIFWFRRRTSLFIVILISCLSTIIQHLQIAVQRYLVEKIEGNINLNSKILIMRVLSA